MRKSLLLLSMLVFLMCPSAALADSSVTLAWDPPSSADVVGVRIYKSQTAGQYTYGVASAAADIPTGTTQATIVKLPDGTVYFVATAYDARGNESGPSNEVNVNLDTTAPNAPSGVRVEVIVKVVVP